MLPGAAGDFQQGDLQVLENFEKLEKLEMFEELEILNDPWIHVEELEEGEQQENLEVIPGAAGDFQQGDLQVLENFEKLGKPEMFEELEILNDPWIHFEVLGHLSWESPGDPAPVPNAWSGGPCSRRGHLSRWSFWHQEGVPPHHQNAERLVSGRHWIVP